MMLTVFTAVYNRANKIGRLYESLCRQTSDAFEWIVVDDGSSDNIDEVMAGFMEEGKLDIRYYKQNNGGKHRAVNRGVKEAKGDFFFIVDSDDYVSDNAVEWISVNAAPIIDDDEFAGISGICIQQDGTRSLGGGEFPQTDSDAIDIRKKHGVVGDLAEVFKTGLLREFPFPDIPGEKFCAEGLVWNRIARAGYKLRYFYEPIYICEYLADGLSMNNVALRRNNPEYSMLLYSEQINSDRFPLKDKIKSALLYWRFSVNSTKKFYQKCRVIPFGYWFLALPGRLMNLFS